jgi:hypothetical protein
MIAYEDEESCPKRVGGCRGLDNIESVKDKFDPRLKDLHIKLRTLNDKIAQFPE